MLQIIHWLTVRYQMLRSDGEHGASAVEYGLLVALIAAVIITAVAFLGDGVNDTFCQVNGALPNTEPCPPE